MKPSSEPASSPTCPQDLMSSPCHLIQQMRKLEGLCAPQTPHGVGKVGTGESVLEPKAASEYPAQVLGPWASPLPTSPTRVALLPDQASSWSSQSPRLGEISPLYPAEVCGEVLKSSEFADNPWEHPRAEAPPPLLRRTSCGSGPSQRPTLPPRSAPRAPPVSRGPAGAGVKGLRDLIPGSILLWLPKVLCSG